MATYYGGALPRVDAFLGYGPTMVPNPAFKKNPYGLADDQALEKWGKSKRIVGKDAPEGFMRNLAGLGDFATLGVYDFDQRGNLFGGEHLPGISGGLGGNVSGSGYGGQAQLGTVPQYIPNQNPYSNVPLGGAVPPITGMGGYYGTNSAIGGMGNLTTGLYTNQFLNNAQRRLEDARQFADAQDVQQSYLMQRTDKGKSQRATEQQERMLAGAQANYLRRMGVAALSNAAANKIKGIDPRANMAHSSQSIFA